MAICTRTGTCLRTLVLVTAMFGVAIGAKMMAGAPTGASGGIGVRRGGDGDPRAERERLLDLAERVVEACGERRLGEDRSACQGLCGADVMCCFEEGQRSCLEDESKDCAVYAGCEVLAFDSEEEKPQASDSSLEAPGPSGAVQPELSPSAEEESPAEVAVPRAPDTGVPPETIAPAEKAVGGRPARGKPPPAPIEEVVVEGRVAILHVPGAVETAGESPALTKSAAPPAGYGFLSWEDDEFPT